ncbi:hypothetical protein NM688_g6211 [Phlebia brevispora]|uniref:Uncharacterized protein n=1 Tax=Phlebia brevispora TaxID=194682 RepID=A0ACC1SIJ2_9APHY|nr:hypothetical protein NM688_g6211 [Phlebia brevispora]
MIVEVLRTQAPILRSHILNEAVPSAQFYFQDCTLFLQTGSVLFRVSESMLGGRQGGRDAAHAIVLENITPSELVQLFYFLWGTSEESEDVLMADASSDALSEMEPSADSAESLVSILRLSVLLGIDSGKRYAISRLDTHDSLSDTKRLSFGIRYNISSWIAKALPQLVVRAVEHWTVADLDAIDKGVLQKIVEFQSAVAFRRRAYAVHPPEARTGCVPILIRPHYAVDTIQFTKAVLQDTNLGMCDNCLAAHLCLLDDIVKEEAAAREEVIAQLTTQTVLLWTIVIVDSPVTNHDLLVHHHNIASTVTARAAIMSRPRGLVMEQHGERDGWEVEGWLWHRDWAARCGKRGITELLRKSTLRLRSSLHARDDHDEHEDEAHGED